MRAIPMAVDKQYATIIFAQSKLCFLVLELGQWLAAAMVVVMVDQPPVLLFLGQEFITQRTDEYLVE